MKTKAFFLTTMMFLFLLICSTGIHAQTAKSNLDQVKLMQQGLGTWEANVGKDSVQVHETQQYGKSFITTVSYNIKGKKTPLYTNNYCFDSKEGKFKGFALGADGSYGTWIGLWTTEKKFNVDAVQNFKPEIVLYKIELVYETPAKMTWTDFKTDGTKTGELKYTKVK
ncbi:MAG TPA: hypothetical protein DCR40_10760 [Prolixibacteraceae bacterium]|nr:hypothetical protein [Prolixibacteraceae bacterium]